MMQFLIISELGTSITVLTPRIPEENNSPTLQVNSRSYKKTNEIIKTMAGLHFSTTDLRNKLSQGHINNNLPIITQVTLGNVSQGQGQVRVEIYLPAQSCWREIRGFLHKEMNLRIKSSFYETLSKSDIYPPMDHCIPATSQFDD